MASSFVGVSVLVTLKDPPGVVVQGVVGHVDPHTSTLGLQDVLFPATGHRIPTYTVEGPQIADIKINSGPQAPPPQQAPPAQVAASIADAAATAPQFVHPHPPYPVYDAGQQTQQQQQQPRQQQPAQQQPPRLLRIPTGPGPAAPHPAQAPGDRHTPPLQQAKRQFVDPAILSFERTTTRPTSSGQQQQQQPQPSQPPQQHVAPLQEAPATPVLAAKGNTPATFMAVPPRRAATDSQKNSRKDASGIAATLSAPFTGLEISGHEEANNTPDDTDDGFAGGPTTASGVRRVSLSKTRTGKPMDAPPDPADGHKRTRRGGKGRKKDRSDVVANQELEEEADHFRERGSGWRQTPLLQSQTAGSPRHTRDGSGSVVAARAAVGRKSRRQQQRTAAETQNGWATEDATDIQEMPEFDFAENLSKFDKRSVFDQIRNEDTTADEDRLVSFNRLPAARPGTYGGKNLHPTENVLDQRGPRPGARRHSSIDFFTNSDYSDAFDSGRNSRRAPSHASLRRQPLRSGSGSLVPGQQDDHHSVSGVSSAGAAAAVAAAGVSGPTLLTRAKSTAQPQQQHARSSLAPHLTASPKASTHHESSWAHHSHHDSSLRHQQQHQQQQYAQPQQSPRPTRVPPCLRTLPPSNRTAHTITPGAMLAVEETAEIDFGLTEDVLAESAGRGIADVALSVLSPGNRRLAPQAVALNAHPLIILVAGNHRTGARALAAARLLLLRGARPVVALLAHDRPADWEPAVRAQVDRLRCLGGRVRSWTDVAPLLLPASSQHHPHPRNGADPHADLGPAELVIDALLSRNREFPALAPPDRRTAAAAIRALNAATTHVPVLSVETPSGLGAAAGEVARDDERGGGPLVVAARHVVCLGAPRAGLLRALVARAEGPQGADGGGGGGGFRPEEWVLHVVDLGLNKAWRKSGVGSGSGGADPALEGAEGIAVQGGGAAGNVGGAAAEGDGREARGRRKGVPFGGEWVVRVQFVGVGAESGGGAGARERVAGVAAGRTVEGLGIE